MRSERCGAYYGIDAPGLVAQFAILGIAGLLVGVGSYLAATSGHVRWMRFLPAPSVSIGATFLATAGGMILGSRWGKLRLRDRIISSIPWRGDESVLDVGCGRGLMLIAAAKRLTTGTAAGVDLWQTEDQSGNSRETTLRNAQLENVAERVTLKDGDARKLEFADGSFDVVLSSWAIHNIYDAPGRELAIREMVRVLKPGGWLVVVDIRHTSEYSRVLEQCLMQNVRRAGPSFVFIIPSFTLTASKRVK